MREHEDMIEISGSIIDIFEDFLEMKGIKIENKEREEYDDGNVEDLAIIFGSDYDWLENKIEEILGEVLK